MREHHADFRTGGPVLTFAAGALLLIAATSVRGQNGPPFAPGSHPDPAKERMIEMQQREAALRGLAIPTKTPTDTRSLQAAVAQIAQDYKQIQILRNEMVHLIETSKTIDFKQVQRATAEIKKRASRLKTYMVVEQQDESEKQQQKKIEIGADDKGLRNALIMLCNQIYSFVENPIFINPGVVDVKQSARLSRDLKSIIEISGEVIKSAEQRRKTVE